MNLFEHAIKTYGSVDIVIVNAGVAESAPFGTLRFDQSGKPLPPSMLTINVNLTGACYSEYSATHRHGLSIYM